ncbi:MAG: cobaltochelatase subunit CobN [Deltaproteobacteria bacterium]|jgi:cobaltochelatase CobN|nr:cobaltochelatase subunit CobN [Deltaproteobacteria bacterium]
MPPFQVTYFSFGGGDIKVLSAAAASLQREGRSLAVRAWTQSQLFDEARQKEFVRKALESDLLVLVLHGGRDCFPAFKALKEALAGLGPLDRRPLIHGQPVSGDSESLEAVLELAPEPGPIWEAGRKYFSFGGRQNLAGFLARMHDHLFPDSPWGSSEPRAVPFDGIYHPDFPDPPELADYLAARIDPRKVTAGLWFYHTYWVNDDTAHIDAVIRALEGCGANVLPLFHMRWRDAGLGNPGSIPVAEKYFLDEQGRSRIDVLLDLMSMSMNLTDPNCKALLPRLNVPVIQGICSYQPRAVWQDSWQGLSVPEVTHSAAMPEFDGKLITVPAAFREENKIDPVTRGLISSFVPDPERTAKLARLTVNWGRLGRTPPAERKIAVIFHHYPPRNDRIGCASGLDSFASVSRILEELKSQGCRVDDTFPDKDSLARTVLSQLTSDRRWLTPEQMSARAGARAGEELWRSWASEIPEANRAAQADLWGPLPGDLFVHNREMLFAGFPCGQVFVTVQPSRGHFEAAEKKYHDLRLPPPHQYSAHYRWLRDVWGAQAFIHVGKHGSLEWLPGKALGLSGECWPDLAIMDLPNIYPYIINDPGEGTQAKRRSYACLVDHLPPASASAGLYDDLTRIEQAAADYRQAVLGDPAKTEALQDELWEAVLAAGLDRDLECRKPAAGEFPEFLARLHGYVQELADTMIADGLHVLGQPPEGERLIEYVVQLTRIGTGDVPSLREALARAGGWDYDRLLENRGRASEGSGGLTGGQIIARLQDQALRLVRRLAETGFDPEAASRLAFEELGHEAPETARILEWIARQLVPDIRLCRQELEAVSAALRGGYVQPGPSGAPSRGQADILPTGRNFYSVDPRKVPSRAAWKTGCALGDALIESALKETGRYPENVGILVYGTCTMRTQGDDAAEILWLLGLKPLWRPDGVTEGLEVIPLAELGRPRIDVTVRISGFFRDAFPNLADRLDEAVRMAAALKEPAESNFIRRHVQTDLALYLAEGKSPEEAEREATFRVFGCPPGTYGAGVAELVEAKAWQTQDDLAQEYIRYSAHAYGRGSYGLVRPDNFRRNLGRMDVTVKNEDSREFDLLSCTDYYNYYGGLIAAAKSVRGTYPLALAGDSSDPRRVRMRTAAQEARHILRSRLVNPKWLAGLKRHGYKGAGDISHMMDVLLGWDATAGIIEDWMYEKAARAWVLDAEMAAWMKEVNPYARQNILDKLLEAARRGLWQIAPEMEEELKEAYLELEGQLEEINDTPEPLPEKLAVR